ncbi:MAG: tyrosine-type recombinase/integrase [Tenericutes bacterium]|jgi:integrase/recombinase XerD|nr:tyrosine-type recombinase/integrase [Mycoplasmatota bacterium]
MKRAASFSKYIYSFLTDFLPNEKNASINTIVSYRDAFRLFFLFMQTKKSIEPTKINIENLKKDDVKAFLDWLENNRKNSIRSRNQRMAALQSFFKYVQYNLPENLFELQKILSMPSKKSKKSEISFMTIKDIKILLSQTDLNTFKGLRDGVLLTLMYDSGSRVQEIIDLMWWDIRINEKPYTIKVHGKGNKYRTIPITTDTVELLKSYKSNLFQKSNDLNKTNIPVFHNSRKSKLTRKGVSYILNKYVIMARGEENFHHKEKISCHVLRHSKAAHMLQANIPLIYIRDFLGHSSIQSTEVYAKLTDELKIKALNNVKLGIHPIPKKSWNADKELMKWLKDLC